MITFNGRITLPSQVRKKLGLKIGDNVEFVENAQGQFAIEAGRADVSDRKAADVKPVFTARAEVMEEIGL